MLKWKRISDPNGLDSVFIAETNLVANNLRVTYPHIYAKVTKRGDKWYFGVWHRHKTSNIPFINSIVFFTSMKAVKDAAAVELESFSKALTS